MNCAQYLTQLATDFKSVHEEFDAIVTGCDPHATALGAIAAAITGKPLMVVCQEPHKCRLSDITTIGDVDPRMRFVYVDDFFAFGATLRKTFDYMNQSARANIVATYEAVTRTYNRI